MDYQTSIGDLASLTAILTTGLLPQVLAAMNDTATIVDGDGRVVAATRPHAIGGHAPVDPQRLGETFIHGLRAVLANRSDSFDHVDISGSPEHCARYRILPLRSAGGGAIIGALIVRHPLTEAIRAERRVSDTLHHVANMVHDLRTELNAVIGFSEMMLEESWGALGDEHYRTYAQHIHLSGTHLLHQVNQVLDLSRVDYLGPELEEEEVDLAELLRQCCQSLDMLAERNGLAMSMEPATAPIIRADPRLTRRVALNLLSNAIKFTPTGGRVSASTGLDAHGRPFLAVRDTGIGIAAEHLDKVMQPFAQIDSPQARRHGDNGSGLGLPLSKRLMELHGGSLHLDSTPNRGTTATAWFPPQRVVAPVQAPG